MKLHGEQGISLELAVQRYQFPERTTGWDANWLVIQGTVEHPEGGWRFFDPCLTTFDLAELAGWLERAATGDVPEPLGFVEPCLSLQASGGALAAVEVRLAHECAPARLGDRDERAEGLRLRFPAARNDFAAAARALRGELVRFPARGKLD